MPDRSRFVLGLDLDGVCFDYYGSIRKYAAEWMNKAEEELTPEFTYGFTEWDIDAHGGYQALHRFLLDSNYFESVPPLPGAPEALQRLSGEGIRIRIITHRLFISGAHQESAGQTVGWLEKYRIPYWDLASSRTSLRSRQISTSKTLS